MQRYIVDTNIFLRVLVKEDDVTYRECLNFLQSIKSNKLQVAVPGVVLTELVWVLTKFYTYPKLRVIESIKTILNIRKLRVVDSYQHKVALRLFTDANVKYIDAVVASIRHLQKKEWIVVSYDKDFDKLGVVRKEPADILKS